MRTLVTLAILVLLGVIVASSAMSDVRLMSRTDVVDGSAVQTYAAFSKGYEAWVCNTETRSLEYMAGKFVPSSQGLTIGGYASYRPVLNEVYLVPTVNVRKNALGGRLECNLGYYVPVTDNGKFTLISKETGLYYQFGKNAEAGPVMTYVQTEGKDAVVQGGVGIRVKIGSIPLKFRWLCKTDDQPTRNRLEANLTLNF